MGNSSLPVEDCSLSFKPVASSTAGQAPSTGVQLSEYLFRLRQVCPLPLPLHLLGPRLLSISASLFVRLFPVSFAWEWLWALLSLWTILLFCFAFPLAIHNTGLSQKFSHKAFLSTAETTPKELGHAPFIYPDLFADSLPSTLFPNLPMSQILVLN